MAQAELNVTVTNFNYTEDLKDPTSETYRAFEELFQKEVRMRGPRPSKGQAVSSMALNETLCFCR